jgi:hypothetical protein
MPNGLGVRFGGPFDVREMIISIFHGGIPENIQMKFPHRHAENQSWK